MKLGLSKRIVSPSSESAWRQWRRAGLGASDIVVIRGLSPFKTRASLLLEKVMRKETSLSKFIQDRAADQEFRARHIVNKIHQCKLEPICIENQSNPRYRASLDGYCVEDKVLMEHKCVGAEHLNCVPSDVVGHIDQMKHQPFVGHLEQLIWQMGMLTQAYVKNAYLSYSLLRGDEFKLVPVSLPWDEVRRIYKCQQAAAKLFLKEWDEADEHKRKNKGVDECTGL